MIKIHGTSTLDLATKNQIEQLVEKEFGHIPIVKETTWASPNWTIIFYQDNEIATFYNIVERNIIVDGKSYFSAGINNVITPGKYRGKGLSKQKVKKNEQFSF